MKNLVLIFLILVVAVICKAQDFSQRRFQDLRLGSRFLVKLDDPKLRSEDGLLWQHGRMGDGYQCTLKIASHYDEELLKRTPSAEYEFEGSPQPQDYVKYMYSPNISELAGFGLTTANPDLPLLSLSCNAMAPVHSGYRGMTLQMISDLIGQPQFFSKPVFAPVTSPLAADFYPEFQKIRLLQPLHFSAVLRGGTGSLGTPVLERGQILYGQSGHCILYYHNEATDDNSYDFIMPAGTEFRPVYGTSAHGQINTLQIQVMGSRAEISLECFATEKAPFQNFSEIEVHTHSVLEFIP